MVEGEGYNSKEALYSEADHLFADLETGLKTDQEQGKGKDHL